MGYIEDQMRRIIEGNSAADLYELAIDCLFEREKKVVMLGGGWDTEPSWNFITHALNMLPPCQKRRSLILACYFVLRSFEESFSALNQEEQTPEQKAQLYSAMFNLSTVLACSYSPELRFKVMGLFREATYKEAFPLDLDSETELMNMSLDLKACIVRASQSYTLEVDIPYWETLLHSPDFAAYAFSVLIDVNINRDKFASYLNCLWHLKEKGGCNFNMRNMAFRCMEKLTKEKNLVMVEALVFPEKEKKLLKCRIDELCLKD